MLAKVNQRKGKGYVRIDRISDGSSACGFAWTWVSSDGKEEGLRGTTFIELNDDGLISYVREIPEPIYKPGDLTVELLKAVTKGAVASPPPPYETKTPRSASQVAKYLFNEVQGGDIDESMRLFEDSIVYRDLITRKCCAAPRKLESLSKISLFLASNLNPINSTMGYIAPVLRGKCA